LGAIFDLKFKQNILNMKPNCTFFDSESYGDLAILASIGNEVQYLELTVAQ